MFMPAMDYNQQLLAYIQTFRQLLDQWAAMAAGLAFPTATPAMPGAPAGGPFMPPMPPSMPPPAASASPGRPAPPAPGDYTQQLFGYLQAWRQYLEQMAGAGPQPPQASTGATDGRPATGGGTSPLGKGPGGESTRRSGDTQGSDATLPPPLLMNIPPSDLGGTQLTSTSPGQTTWPPLLDVPPGSYMVSQISGPGFDPVGHVGQTPTEPEVLRAPSNYFGTEAAPPPRVPARLPAPQRPSGVTAAGTAFQSAMDRLDTTAVREVAPKSLFAAPGAETPSTRLREVGKTPPAQQ